MASAPDPITSPPDVPGQPYDATASGGSSHGTQSDPEGVYDAAGWPDAEAWPKIQDGGAADMASGRIQGGWPSDGTSDGGAWKQCLQRMLETALFVITPLAAVARPAQDLVTRREVLHDQPAVEVMPADGTAVSEDLPAMSGTISLDVIDGEVLGKSRSRCRMAAWWGCSA